MKGQCAICGLHKELSFEHIPPKKAFNESPIYYQNYLHLFDEQNYLFGKKSKSPRGFGNYTLCQKCNNETGDWYARDYIEWAHQAMEILLNNKGTRRVVCNFTIKPLNVIKQVMAMFLSADKIGVFRENPEFQKFVLEKENNSLPDNYKLFLYLNHSNAKRFLGYQVVYDEQLPQICKWSEISFKPFGFLLTDDSPPANLLQTEISFFKKYAYDQKEHVRLPLFYLGTPNAIIGTYT